MENLLFGNANSLLSSKLFVALAGCALACQHSSLIGRVDLYFVPDIHPGFHEVYLSDTGITTNAIMYARGLTKTLWKPSNNFYQRG